VSWALFFLLLAPIVAIIYLVWAYRKKAAARAAASNDRLAGILDPGTPRPGAADAAPQPAPQAESPNSVAPLRGVASYARRAGLLDAGQMRLREALRAGLPRHELFAHVSLAAVVEVTGLPEGRERDQRLRALAQQTVDCVVCDSTFAIVAVVDLEDGQSAERQFKAECLRAAGIRYLRWHPAELPSGSSISALIAET
jgi:hypothetical protein